MENTRLDLHKEFCSGDPIRERHPYDIATKLIPLVGLLRFEINNPSDSANAEGWAGDWAVFTAYHWSLS